MKNWCFWTVVLEKTLEGPLDFKEIQPVHPKGNQSWIFIGSTDVEAEIPILWPPDAKNWLIGKDPDARKDWRWEEKGMTEDKMIGWHHPLDGNEFEQALGVGDGLGSLCTAIYGIAKSQTWLSDWTELFSTKICSIFVMWNIFMSTNIPVANLIITPFTFRNNIFFFLLYKIKYWLGKRNKWGRVERNNNEKYKRLLPDSPVILWL